MTEPRRQFPSDDAYCAAAKEIGCEVAAIKAVAEVEAGKRGAFLKSGEPVILFEPHIFSRLTRGRFDRNYPAISYPKWKAGAYGSVESQHVKLAKAVKLDRDAALQSASFGLFQILGVNYRRAGHETVQSFVNAVYESVDEHLRMFVRFILSDRALVQSLRERDWATFARGYNGAGYKAHNYHGRMREAYERLTA